MTTIHYALVAPADDGCRVRDDSYVVADGVSVRLPARVTLPSGNTSRIAPHRIAAALYEIHGDVDLYFADGRQPIPHETGFKIGYYLGAEAAVARRADT